MTDIEDIEEVVSEVEDTEDEEDELGEDFDKINKVIDNDEELEYEANSDVEEIDIDDVEQNNLSNKKSKKYKSNSDEEDDSNYDTDDDNNTDNNYDDDGDDEKYLQKLENKDIILENHRETLSVNYNAINELCNILRNGDGQIDDPHHRTIPILSKYEKTKIIGIRAKQLNNGATAFVNVAEHIIDGLIIAQQELREKKVPFIIKRPVANSHFEYWRLHDLEIL